jgi:hypothetical protein
MPDPGRRLCAQDARYGYKTDERIGSLELHTGAMRRGAAVT